MTGDCHKIWLRRLLAGAVILPAFGIVVHAVWSVYFSADWYEATDAPGFGLFGMSLVVSFALLAIWLAVRAYVQGDSESHQAAALGCGFVVLLMTISLGDAVAVWLGFKEGRLPRGMVIGVTGVWVYVLVVGVGHWYLTRNRSPSNRLAETRVSEDVPEI